VLAIPCYHRLAKLDLQHIVRSLNQAWARVNPDGPCLNSPVREEPEEKNEVHVRNE
jgi:hypothetical protein